MWLILMLRRIEFISKICNILNLLNVVLFVKLYVGNNKRNEWDSVIKFY